MVKNPLANAGDKGLIPDPERSLGGRNGNSLQNSCLGNPMDRGARRTTVHGVIRVRHNLGTKPPPPSLPENTPAPTPRLEREPRKPLEALGLLPPVSSEVGMC